MARKPRPTNLKILEGNPGKRKLIQTEMDISTEMPLPPDYLPQYAIEEWWERGPGLNSLGLLNHADAAAFTIYCVAVGRLRAALELVSEIEKTSLQDSIVVVTRTGSTIQNPLQGIISKASADIDKYGGRFGLNPQDRTSVAASMAGRNKKSKFDGLISSGKK